MKRLKKASYTSSDLSSENHNLMHKETEKLLKEQKDD